MKAQSLRVSGLQHAYALEPVLAGIDLVLAAGQVTAMVGPSGCGKTTLLHLCAGLLQPQSGHIESGFRRPAIVFQQPRLLPWLDTCDNIALGLKALGLPRRDRRERAAQEGRAMGLDQAALAQYPAELSGGMQSRAALARALAIEPDLLLLDEPFSALDIGLKDQLHRLLLRTQAAQGLAVLMITHDLIEAVRLAGTVLVMAAGPGRLVYRLGIAEPAAQRDDAWCHHAAARLLHQPVVRQAFDMAPVVVPGATMAPVASHPVERTAC